jgi:hypothetical protein
MSAYISGQLDVPGAWPLAAVKMSCQNPERAPHQYCTRCRSDHGLRLVLHGRQHKRESHRGCDPLNGQFLFDLLYIPSCRLNHGNVMVMIATNVTRFWNAFRPTSSRGIEFSNLGFYARSAVFQHFHFNGMHLLPHQSSFNPIQSDCFTDGRVELLSYSAYIADIRDSV